MLMVESPKVALAPLEELVERGGILAMLGIVQAAPQLQALAALLP